MENKPAVITVSVVGNGEASEIKVDFAGGSVPLPALIASLEMIIEKLSGIDPKPIDRKDIN